MARRCPSFSALAAVAAIVLALHVAPAVAVGSHQLKVGCQAGQPPYSDFDHANPTRCTGLFADMFYTIANRMSLNYTMDIVHSDHIDHLLEVNATTGESEYDMFVSFHTVSPERIRVLDFSVSVYQTDYRVALLPHFHSPRVTLVKSVIRDSVLYLFSVIALIAAIMAVVIFVFEHAATEPADLLEQPLWQRVFWAMEQGLEATINGGTGGDLRHPVTRVLRTFAGLIGLIYMVGIFGAVITSQMTTSALNSGDPTVTDLRGERVASSSPSITPYLESPQVGIVVRDVPDIEEYAESFYNRSSGHLDSGFVAPSATVVYLHNLHNGKDRGYLITDAFTATGSVDLKAFPFSKLANRTLFAAFNVHAQHMREDGELAELIDKWVVDPETPTADDFPTPEQARLALSIVCGIGFGAVVIGSFLLLFHDTLKARAEARRNNAMANGGSPCEEAIPSTLVYKGKTYHNISPTFAAVLDAAIAVAQREKGAEMNFSVQDAEGELPEPTRPRRFLGLPLDGVPKDEQEQRINEQKQK